MDLLGWIRIIAVVVATVLAVVDCEPSGDG
jgi:hypothetical protein